MRKRENVWIKEVLVLNGFGGVIFSSDGFTHLFVPLSLGGRESHPTDEELPHAVPLVLVTRRCN